MTTRKMLVPIDLEHPEKDVNDFLYPSKLEGRYVLKGIKSGKLWDNGVVTFVGRTISKNDIFARIVDSKTRIDDVELMLKSLDQFVDQIKNLKLGTVAGIETNNESFIIKVIGKKPRVKRNYRLP